MSGFQDNSITILAMLAGVTGGSLQRGQILLVGLATVIAGASEEMNTVSRQSFMFPAASKGGTR